MKKHFNEIESRAEALLITVQELCAEAGIHQSVWSRAKAKGRARPATFSKMFDALERLEAARG